MEPLLNSPRPELPRRFSRSRCPDSGPGPSPAPPRLSGLRPQRHCPGTEEDVMNPETFYLRIQVSLRPWATSCAFLRGNLTVS